MTLPLRHTGSQSLSLTLHRPFYFLFTESLTFVNLQDLMKGYIARERATIVLSKKGAFPGTGV